MGHQRSRSHRIFGLVAAAGALAACSAGEGDQAVPAAAPLPAPTVADSPPMSPSTEASTPPSTPPPESTATAPASTVASPEDPASALAPTGQGPIVLTESLGGRAYQLVVPSGHRGAGPLPLVMMLHGYTSSGVIQESYFALAPLAEQRGFLLAAPDGTFDPVGNRFWNATEACCDFAQSEVDDVGHLMAIIAQIGEQYEVDPDRIHLVGHSNGGFMSYRLACEHADVFASLVSLAGAALADPSTCRPSEPVGVVQIHGTLDRVIQFDGGATPLGGVYPSAVASVSAWAAANGCGQPVESSGLVLDLDAGIDGPDTSVMAFEDCPAAGSVELWTIDGGGHVPTLTDEFRAAVVDALLARPKTAS